MNFYIIFLVALPLKAENTWRDEVIALIRQFLDAKLRTVIRLNIKKNIRKSEGRKKAQSYEILPLFKRKDSTKINPVTF